jgi:hypothetical protein
MVKDRTGHQENKGQGQSINCKKSVSIFPSPARMSITKLSLAMKNLIIPGQGEFAQ